MKKSFKLLLIISIAVIGLSAFAACQTPDSEKDILVVARTSGSGTRAAFEELVKNAEGATLAKDKDGKAYTQSPLVSSAEELEKTGLVITKVSTSKTAIGYISLGALNDTVKAIKVDGVEATVENVKNGSYKMSRPFNLYTKKGITLTAAAADFMSFLKSKQAQEVVKAEGYVDMDATEDYTAPAAALSGKVVLRGSTSVDEPLMNSLIAKYKLLAGENASAVEFDKDAQGTSKGIAAVKADAVGNVIGMGSSATKDADKPEVDEFKIAVDAIAIIVNKENTTDNVTIAQLFDIYTGATTKFSQLTK